MPLTKFVASDLPLAGKVGQIVPGFLLSAIVAVVAVYGGPYVAKYATIPAMVLALIVGIVLNPIAVRPSFQAGLSFCAKQLLRWSVALLGLRISLGDIIGLGVSTAVVVIVSMAITIVAGFFLARSLGLSATFGALAGAGTAVCGASATLATATVLPGYRGKDADVAFVVIAVNALATIAMVVYPPLAAAFGLDEHTTGILLGATIHDVAQVVGAGYAVSDTVGNTAVIVKLFRVFMLLPVVLAIGWRFAGATANTARVPLPVFAFVFLALCILNSALPSTPLSPLYSPAKDWLVTASTDGLLIAISALGLSTSFSSIASLGWRHMVAVVGTTVVILIVVASALVALR